jgi:hypothetical protein
MAIFPSYVKYAPMDTGEKISSIVERSEMEKGLPKQRRNQTSPLVKIGMTLYFDSKENYQKFEDWFFNDINAGTSFFDFKHPRTGLTVQARIPSGELGELQRLGTAIGTFSMGIEFEYLKVITI